MTGQEWSKIYQENKWKTNNATNYLENLNRRYFKLSFDITETPDDPPDYAYQPRLAYYTPRWRRWHNDPKFKHGGITFNLLPLFSYSEEYIFQVARHELVHAICDMRYDNMEQEYNWHGPLFIKVAKLLRVDTERYERELKQKHRSKDSTINCCTCHL